MHRPILAMNVVVVVVVMIMSVIMIVVMLIVMMMVMMIMAMMVVMIVIAMDMTLGSVRLFKNGICPATANRTHQITSKSLIFNSSPAVICT
jgi:hypothetical protein